MIMNSFNLLPIVFGLFSLAYLCEGSLTEDFCANFSFWDVIKYKDSSATCCDTVLKENCITKTERVCADATEIKCNTVAWTECATKIWAAQGTKCHVTYKDFLYKDCEEEKYSVKHKKKVPACETVTKDNCVPDWTTGEEKCEPVTWQECEIVQEFVDFPAVKTNCGIVGNVKWADFIQGTTEIVELEEDCKTVAWSECATKIWAAQGTKCHVTYKDFLYKDCEEEKYSVKHKKKVPQCETVTKDNCVPDWTTGEEKCEPITWQECEIVEEFVDFPAVKTNCGIVGNVKWADFFQGTTEIVELEEDCKVISSVNCVPVAVNNCVEVRYTECEMKGYDSCYPQTVYEPEQEYIQPKKCLT